MKNLFQITVTLLILITIIYTYTRAGAILSYPQIDIYVLENNAMITNPVTLKGRIVDANYLSINDLDVKLDSDGSFSVVRSLTPGYAEIKFYARNKHGKEETVFRYIYIKE